jgi:rod shape-determining protein MreB
MVMGVPRDATSVEKRAAKEACLSAGARHAFLLKAPMAAAIGAGLPVDQAAGSLVVDIGGGTCEAALISLGEIVVSRSIRVGGDDFDEAITKHLKREHGLLIDEQTAEEVKFEIGSTYPIDDALEAEVRGRELGSGLPKRVVMRSGAIREALEKPVARIVDAVTATLSEAPPQLDADIIDRGMLLTGGGSLLRGLKERLRDETQMPVELAELPLTCVAAGSGVSVEELATDRRFEQEDGKRAA